MKRSAFILFLVLFATAIFGQSASPKIRDVVKQFYGTYRTDELAYRTVSFEKRKEGWYVVTQRVNGNQPETVDKILFYDNLAKKYNPLSLAKNEDKEDVNPSDYLDEYDLRNYDAQFFYGYKGWYKDVIREFKDRKQLSDDEVNGLARAYSIHAAALLSDQSGDAVANEIWQLPLKMDCLTAAQINEFNFLEVKAQEYFKKLADRNPDYETIVGKIGVKYANEVMFQYTILLAYANKYALQMKLPADLYTPEQLEAGKKNLEDCPANAILLSFGDNDYYPVHYLQQARGIRRDVHLINYNLIGLDRYIYRATQPQYESGAVKLSAEMSLYSGKNNDVIYIRDSSHAISFGDLVRLMQKGSKGDNGFLTLKADSILLEKNKGKTGPGITIGTDAVMPLNKARYLYKNQWILLDIIDNLDGRKICFPNDFIDELEGLNDHLSRKEDLYIYDN